MTDHEADAPGQQVETRRSRVRGLRAAVYSRTDPADDAGLLAELAREEAELNQQEQQLAATPDAAAKPSRSARAFFLGPETTKLQVTTRLCMQPLPTAIYNLLDPETDPLLEVVLENKDYKAIKRVRVSVFIEGISARQVRTVEIEPEGRATLKLLPTLLPSPARRITEIQRGTLHVVVDDLDGAQESHDTFSVVCLARTTSFNTVLRPDTGQPIDLTHYYGAWVTPYREEVQAVIRRAADLLHDRQFWGYQGDHKAVTRQVAALYQALQQSKITYINSVIDFGAPPGLATQRTRLPRESLSARAANCIDGTVLMASLLEGVSLNPALVIVPGHAFVGWETWDGSDEWQFLETTMIGTHDFATACRSGQHQFEEARKYGQTSLKMHRLAVLRTGNLAYGMRGQVTAIPGHS